MNTSPETRPPDPNKEDSFEKVERILGKMEYLVFKIAFFLYMVYKLVEYGWYLFKNWH